MEWYKKHRNTIHGLLIVVSLLIIYILAKTNLHNRLAQVLTFRKELKLFYTSFFSGYHIINAASWKMLFAAAALLIVSWYYSYVHDKRGLILYNIALGTFAGVLIVYMAASMIVARVFMWVFIPLIIITALLVILISVNRKFYQMNEDADYDESKSLKWFIPMLVLCAAWIGYCIAPVAKKLPDLHKDKYDDYIEYQESRLLYAFGTLENISENMTEDKNLYIKVWFVNHFNDEGEEYNPEELAEAAQNLRTQNGKSWYRFQQFCDSYWAVEGEYSFDRYDFNEINTYADGNSGIFLSCVRRRLENTGIAFEEADEEDIDLACEYVQDIFVSDEELKTIADVSFEPVAPVPGEEPEYDVTFELGNGYAAHVYKWARVSHVGSANPIEYLTPENGKKFEDNSVYLAEIEVIHDVDYVVDADNVSVELPGVNYRSYDVRTGFEKGDVYVYVWFETGEPLSQDGLEAIDSFNIDSIGNVSIGDSAVCDETIVQVDNENAVVSVMNWWRCVDTDIFYMKDETFSDAYDSYVASFHIYSDTGYIMSTNVKITYDGIPVYEKKSGAENDSMTYFTLYPENSVYNEAWVRILYNRIRTDAENGTLTADCDFAYNGSSVKLIATPDEGYRFVKYVVTDNGGTEKDVEIENGVLIMPDYPVCVTAVFEKE